MFAVQLHEAPSWILGRNREKTSAHRRKLSDKPPPRQFPFWHKVKVLHLPAPLKGEESSSRKSGHFALIWGVFCSVEVLRLVLHFSGVTHVLRCCVCGQRCSNRPIRVLRPAGGVATGSPGCHFTERWKLMRRSKILLFLFFFFLHYFLMQLCTFLFLEYKESLSTTIASLVSTLLVFSCACNCVQ